MLSMLSMLKPKYSPIQEEVERRQFRSLSPGTIKQVGQVEEIQGQVEEIHTPIWATDDYQYNDEIEENDSKLIKALRSLESKIILTNGDLFNILDRTPYKNLSNDYKNKIYLLLKK